MPKFSYRAINESGETVTDVLEADFAVSCSQCGGEEFQELFPIPAEVYRVYGPEVGPDHGRDLVVSVYACLQCGHVEKFVERAELGGPQGETRAAAEE